MRGGGGAIRVCHSGGRGKNLESSGGKKEKLRRPLEDIQRGVKDLNAAQTVRKGGKGPRKSNLKERMVSLGFKGESNDWRGFVFDRKKGRG